MVDTKYKTVSHNGQNILLPNYLHRNGRKISYPIDEQKQNVSNYKRPEQNEKKIKENSRLPRAIRYNAGSFVSHNFRKTDRGDTQEHLPDCDLTLLMKYLARLQVISPESIIKLASGKDINEMCKMLERNLKDIDKYLATCKPPQQRELYPKLINGVHGLDKKICKDKEFKKEFISHESCFLNLTEKYNTCAGPVDWLEEPNPSQVCKTSDDIRNCYYNETEEICGHESALVMNILIKEIFNSVLTVDCSTTTAAVTSVETTSTTPATGNKSLLLPTEETVEITTASLPSETVTNVEKNISTTKEEGISPRMKYEATPTTVTSREDNTIFSASRSEETVSLETKVEESSYVNIAITTVEDTASANVQTVSASTEVGVFPHHTKGTETVYTATERDYISLETTSDHTVTPETKSEEAALSVTQGKEISPAKSEEISAFLAVNDPAAYGVRDDVSTSPGTEYHSASPIGESGEIDISPEHEITSHVGKEEETMIVGVTSATATGAETTMNISGSEESLSPARNGETASGVQEKSSESQTNVGPPTESKVFSRPVTEEEEGKEVSGAENEEIKTTTEEIKNSNMHVQEGNETLPPTAGVPKTQSSALTISVYVLLFLIALCALCYSCFIATLLLNIITYILRLRK